MGKVKRLWQDTIDKIYEDFANKKITFNEAYNMLCRLGYEPDYAFDSLTACSQMELFPETTGARYGEYKYD